jgi:hypothetical protein
MIAERAKAGFEILERLFAEIIVRIIREERTINLATSFSFCTRSNQERQQPRSFLLSNPDRPKLAMSLLDVHLRSRSSSPLQAVLC